MEHNASMRIIPAVLLATSTILMAQEATPPAPMEVPITPEMVEEAKASLLVVPRWWSDEDPAVAIMTHPGVARWAAAWDAWRVRPDPSVDAKINEILSTAADPKPVIDAAVASLKDPAKRQQMIMMPMSIQMMGGMMATMFLGRQGGVPGTPEGKRWGDAVQTWTRDMGQWAVTADIGSPEKAAGMIAAFMKGIADTQWKTAVDVRRLSFAELVTGLVIIKRGVDAAGAVYGLQIPAAMKTVAVTKAEVVGASVRMDLSMGGAVVPIQMRPSVTEGGWEIDPVMAAWFAPLVEQVRMVMPAGMPKIGGM
jgi:hypothetical protein